MAILIQMQNISYTWYSFIFANSSQAEETQNNCHFCVSIITVYEYKWIRQLHHEQKCYYSRALIMPNGVVCQKYINLKFETNIQNT